MKGILPVDYHVHPAYSLDAEGSIEAYCQKGLDLGLGELCLTPHFDIFPGQAAEDGLVRAGAGLVPMTDRRWLKEYVAEAKAADAKYAPMGLRVKVGLEVDYFPGGEGRIAQALAGLPLDFLLCAVHYLEGGRLSARGPAVEYFRGTTPREALAEYGRRLEAAAASGLFDSVAHLDIYRKYGELVHGPGSFAPWETLLEPGLAAVAAAGMTVELNLSPLRRGGQEPHPSGGLLRVCRDLGIAPLTVGSDSHSPEVMGLGYQEGRDVLRRAGFTAVRTYTAREAHLLKLA